MDDPHVDRFAQVYRDEGFAVVRGLLSPELVARVAADADEILRSDRVGRWNARFHYWRGTGETPERIEPVVDLAPAAAEAADSRPLRRHLAAALGDLPRLVKDKIVLAPPGSTGYELHQDYVFYPLCNPDRMIAVAIALDRTTPENGLLRMYPGQTCRSYTHWQPRALAPSEIAQLEAACRPVEVAQEPGDAIFFHSLTPHGSGPNRSARPRRILHLTFNAASVGDLYVQQRRAYLAQIPGLGGGFE